MLPSRRHPDPPHVLPLPTRRTSDLESGPLLSRSTPVAAFPCSKSEPARPICPVSTSGGASPRREHAHRERRKAAQQRDRKSTRLNSSHLGTSYAVFCL